MKKADLEARRKRFQFKRKINAEYMCAIDAYTHPREMINRAIAGKPINEKFKEHQVLPADGEVEEDFDTGTEEVLDLVDAQRISEQAEAKLAKRRELLEKQQAEKQYAEVEKKAKELAAKMVAEQSNPPAPPA